MKIILFTLFLILLFSCSTENINEFPITDDPISSVIDSHTYSNYNNIRTNHLHLDLEVNFNNHTIYGVARHEMTNHSVDTAIFDIKELDIQRVTIGKDKEVPTDYVIGKMDSLLGSALSVKINKDTKYINIYYQTTEKTEALDWLLPEMTEGKEHPFLYTQGQAILTRSWIPLQDTPSNRITYSADVKVPAELMAVMSASNPTAKNNEGRYHFEMKQRIPAYLIALAVGNLEYVKLGENSGIYSEPELSKQCKFEFEDLPKMIQVAESIYGKYQWEQYDIVMLPYSFPFGGMENPRLTFANPTLLAGDKSLISVVAHELAHSWSGNLVTNATWNDFWLNEGFTVYFENRIMEEISGKEIADILALIEYQDLVTALETIENGEHPEDTQLKLHLEGRNPDDGMTDIAYIKGAYFLRTIESIVGRKKLDPFLLNYFNTNAFKSISTEDFVKDLNKNLLEPNNVEFNVNDWIYKPGLPENHIQLESDRLDFMNSIAEKLNNNQNVFDTELKGKVRNDFITQEWQTLIRSLNPSIETMKLIDEHLQFSTESNPAIKSDWFNLAIRTGYNDAKPEIEKYLMKIGRRWYIESIYQSLKDSENKEDLKFARDVFEKAKPSYHFVSKSTIQELLDE